MSEDASDTNRARGARPALEGLAGEQYLNLETFKRDGAGVKTPVWFAVLDGALVVFTDGTSYR